jgi:autophagy-related protein 17
MAMSPSSASSSESRSYHDNGLNPENADLGSGEFNADDVPVEVLVKHLLAAKQSLSSITLVWRAHDLATHARQMHEEAVILSAQTSFLRQGISEQVRILRQVRRGMNRAYDGGRNDFKKLIRTLDAANSRLEQAINVLRGTIVDPVFRPAGEEEKCLMDFVDEKTVDSMRDTVKESIKELQVSPHSSAAPAPFLGYNANEVIRRLLRLHSMAISSASTPTCAPLIRPCPRPLPRPHPTLPPRTSPCHTSSHP